MIKSKTYIATPPGSTIKEQLADKGMNQKELATRMAMSEKHISKLINGEVQLTPDVALRLEMVLGVPARFWSNLEAIYREKLALVQAENEMGTDVEIAKKFPYKEMSRMGWVPVANVSEERVMALRKYFELVKLSMLSQPLIPGIACRRQSVTEKADYALLAWAQKAKLEARTIETKPIDLQKLEMSIPVFRAMTSQKPDLFCPRLKAIMADCGIALVFLPHIGGSFLHGASFVEKSKIVMGLTVRGKDADRFWFSLFHEIAHILKGHIYNPDGTTEKDEQEADLFAQETLIPSGELNAYVTGKEISDDSLNRFARMEGIDVGILVGRLQQEGRIPFNRFNELKTHYELSI